MGTLDGKDGLLHCSCPNLSCVETHSDGHELWTLEKDKVEYDHLHA